MFSGLPIVYVWFFVSVYVEEFSDDALSAHESELDRMNGFYADNVNVFKMVEKRQKLWEQKMMFEVSW